MRLGKKLQIRNDARTTKYSRLEDGRVDKKLLSSLGYGNEHIFYHTEIDKFNPVILHISVDASSSMAGEKWDKTMTTVVAICKAASMVSNLNVVVSFRSITITNGGAGAYRYRSMLEDVFPLVAIAYDSRVDKFVKIKQLFKYIIPNGSTPEGLAFASILDEMVEGNPQKLDSYFLNLSDGEPYFISRDFSYSKQLAGKHTNSIVRMIRARGINVMSYFISDTPDANSEIFKLSYDKDARFINVNNIVELATTLNELFLRKG
jgi:nitric oxide reductase activation protein